jgi:hypothetical protein
LSAKLPTQTIARLLGQGPRERGHCSVTQSTPARAHRIIRRLVRARLSLNRHFQIHDKSDQACDKAREIYVHALRKTLCRHSGTRRRNRNAPGRQSNRRISRTSIPLPTSVTRHTKAAMEKHLMGTSSRAGLAATMQQLKPTLVLASLARFGHSSRVTYVR